MGAEKGAEGNKGVEIRVRGQVQGVGFRPFVWHLARDMGLTGTVRNDAEGVLIQLFDGSEGFTDIFERRLRAELPPLARIDAVELCEIAGERAKTPKTFDIIASKDGAARTRVTPDAATCDHCLNEVRDANMRRHGYAFTNCTHCGPRFTIVTDLPYDRPKTTMAPFEMCPACRAEYEDPEDRRFHAQPIACPECGPKLWLEPATEGDPISETAKRLRAGEIVAIKGLGGFHLACDALNAEAVALLRRRKHRPAKPFALMGTLETIRHWCAVSEEEQALLEDPAAPIVLLEMHRPVGAKPHGIAPGQATLGWMLPYTPLHHLLIDAMGGPLVMTSGNLSGEPQVIGNAEARDKLAGFADAFLMHDREIARRLDDSVERITEHGPMVLRRARGRVPGTLPLPKGFEEAPQVVAYGGQMKGAICLLKDGQALLGHHLGELDEALTYEAFLKADADYAALFDHHPELIACDLHPEFRATLHAYARAEKEGQRVEEVQHHHAHLAACLGENLWPLEGGKVAGIVLDGLGLGTDGTVWGGEVLLGDYRGFTRKAWLKPAPLIGGDRAAKEPWRNALARLDQAGLSEWADELFADKPLAMARRAVEKGMNCPMSSSAGRLFDAVAACLGVCADGQSFEGEAAMRLEAMATQAPDMGVGFSLPLRDGELDPAPMFAELQGLRQHGQSLDRLAWMAHAGLSLGFAQEARRLVEAGEAQAVVLSGGCFQNALLLQLMAWHLGNTPILTHTKTPANDGGLALGQALIAAARHL
ncbi:carbamoyltransferase HypF [Celeribacter neptunius]|uniref:Carbamoyltransferase HypF n=1 Tax=Celeribacter neptunius TaxID=588602 RepID=A0A1I3NIQ7_9RHOB|nr:carbamoyltransferase HypF [Celeribacter neptunius]SFJ08850.1 Hydrogenase maturation protein, carbamoyltransferase HypF [Celeribacter neptunius]